VAPSHLLLLTGLRHAAANAVMDLQDWATDPDHPIDPPWGGEIVIGAHGGRGYEHCFNGYLPDGTPAPNAVTRELYLTKASRPCPSQPRLHVLCTSVPCPHPNSPGQFLPRMAKRWAASAPPGANMEWASY
jgi:hypothetical protein